MQHWSLANNPSIGSISLTITHGACDGALVGGLVVGALVVGALVEGAAVARPQEISQALTVLAGSIPIPTPDTTA